MRSVLGFCCVLALVVLAGCASRKTCDACTKPPPQQQYACNETAVTAALGPTSLLKSPTPIDMLFLSGGGSHGAYGAGVLNGWSAASRPEFAVVTAVSAGALQATWAFLGGSQFDQEMYHHYTSVSDNDIYKTRPLIALLWSSSTTTADGLKQVIEKAVPNGTIDLVAAQKGRRLLCVGTVNLDTGLFVAWDMTAIAADMGNANRYALYRDVLRASASVPIVSPPVKIGNTLYIDGGTREEVFTTPLLNEIAAYRQQPGVAPGQHDRAHFLINLDLNVHPQCVVPRIKDIAKRTLQLVLAEGVYGSVFRSLTEMTLDASKRTDVDYRYIPSSFTVGFKSDKFDPALMCRLFCKGFADGKQPWATNLEKMPVEGQACAANDFPGDATPCAGPVPNCP